TTPAGLWGIYRSVGGRVIEVATTATTAPHGRSSFDELFTEKLSATGDDVGFLGTASQVAIPGYFRTSPGFLTAVADDTTVGSIVSVFGGELRGTEAILLLSTDMPFHGLVRTDGTSWTVLLERQIIPGLGSELIDVPSWDGTTVAFWGHLLSSSTGSLEDGIYAIRDDTLITLADTTTIVPGGVGAFTSFEREVSVDGDLVAFVARDANSSYGVYVANVATGSVLVVANTNTTIPGTQLPFGHFFVGQSDPSVSAGRVAFAGRSITDPTQGGIYLWEAGTLSEVVQILEPLPPSGGPAFGLLGRDGLDGDRLAFGNGLGVWIAVLPQTLIFSDGFESGDTSAW
ncbi:MAG: hypothetical protein K8J08_14445, partial [Thermoanaerobaculia bacterium]|nr:hypothetical protein [Thermoanaerobaculia bacterium]